MERVLRAVELIPPGRVASYGDIAELVGITPRQVGTVLRLYGSNVTWWRVTGHAGDFGGDLLRRARPHWDAEGIAVKPNGLGCRIVEYRLDLQAWARAWERAVADLPAPTPRGRGTAARRARHTAG